MWSSTVYMLLNSYLNEKVKKKIFQHKKLRLGYTKTAFGINIRVTLQKKGNKSKSNPQEGACIHLIVTQCSGRQARHSLSLRGGDPTSSESYRHPSR